MNFRAHFTDDVTNDSSLAPHLPINLDAADGDGDAHADVVAAAVVGRGADKQTLVELFLKVA